ncbi:MAG: AMP-dependent synthetase and ligase [Actinomycetia bacterium]|nr:AMP-dependent synthetase and ligase [Actinomycetes bacterium]
MPDTLAELVRLRAGDPNLGLRFEDQRWTWAEVEEEMEVRGAFLQSLLTGEPRHFGVLLDNIPEYLFLLGGAALSATTLAGINTTRRGEELARDIRHADCQVLVTDSAYAEVLRGLDLGPATDRVIVVDTPDYAAALEPVRGPGAPRVTGTPVAEDLLLLIFTSGSTGAPKAVRMTQGRAARGATNQMGHGPADVLYVTMPVFHGNALSSMVFPSLTSGASLVLKRKFSASGWLPDVREYGCTFSSTIGRALAYILGTPPTEHDKDHKLKYILAPEASTADMKAFRKRFGVPAFGGYGSSENAIILAPKPGQSPEALGVPPEGHRIAVINPDTNEECARARFDADGRLVNADESIGELVGLDAVGRFEGYYNNDEANNARTRDGWYWSGDLAYRDDDDVFYFAGRDADWIRVDGENFAGAPVERVIARFPGVAGVAVFGVPDDRTIDDQVMAVVELADDAGFDPAAFDEFLAGQRDLGVKWSPRYLRIVPSLPVTGTNKIDKAPLRKARWIQTGHDPVYWRPDRRDPLQPLTDDDRAEILRRFDANGRTGVLHR